MIKLVAAIWRRELTLIDDWRAQVRRLWSIRIALFWGGLSGLIAVWSAFSEVIPLWLYASVGVIANVAIVGARVTKQPGATDGAD
jgi:hypothetical protein